MVPMWVLGQQLLLQNWMLAYEVQHGRAGRVGEHEQFHQMSIHDRESKRSMFEQV